MDNFMDFVFSTGNEIYHSSDGLIAPALIIFLIIIIIFVTKKGLVGVGFWGKKREKIAEFEFINGDRTRRLFIYQLSDKSGYKGYGLEFTNSKVKSYMGNIGMKSSLSAMEFTKDEADQLIDLIRPHL